MFVVLGVMVAVCHLLVDVCCVCVVVCLFVYMMSGLHLVVRVSIGFLGFL